MLKCLGICLFRNDGDIAEDHIEYLLNNNHEIVIFDHSSTDETKSVIEKYKNQALEVVNMEEKFTAHEVFEFVSHYVMTNYMKKFDWISFPESDEFLEGPKRDKSYFEYIREVMDSPHSWVQFTNFIYWFTEVDNIAVSSPVKRMKYYCRRYEGGDRIYAWKADAMNIRDFNHNAALGTKYPIEFNSRHYFARNELQLMEKLTTRANKNIIEYKYDLNRLYERIKDNLCLISSEQLHYDDGNELNHTPKINWAPILRL